MALGDYTKTTWVDGTTGITATRLNNIENKVDEIDTLAAPIASPTFTGTPAAPTAAAATDTTQLATTAFVHDAIALDAPDALLAEYVVSGSAVTSIDLTGLDINTHKSYRVEAELKNATASSCVLYLHVNADTTEANYYNQIISASGTSVTAARSNTSSTLILDASSVGGGFGHLYLLDGYPRADFVSSKNTASTVINRNISWAKTATVTNITQLTFTASVANSIGIGSKIRIYRGDA